MVPIANNTPAYSNDTKAILGLCFMAFITAIQKLLYAWYSGEGRNGIVALASAIFHSDHWNPSSFILVVNQEDKLLNIHACVLFLK